MSDHQSLSATSVFNDQCGQAMALLTYQYLSDGLLVLCTSLIILVSESPVVAHVVAAWLEDTVDFLENFPFVFCMAYRLKGKDTVKCSLFKWNVTVAALKEYSLCPGVPDLYANDVKLRLTSTKSHRWSSPSFFVMSLARCIWYRLIFNPVTFP